MQVCSKCKTPKAASNFPERTGRQRRTQAWCKKCHREYDRKYYANHKRKYRDRNRRYRDDCRRCVYEYLKSHPCVDCGESDPVVLEFDHVRGNKDSNIATLVFRATNPLRVIEEITKCEVRCANCHRRKTFGASFKGRMKLFESLDVGSTPAAPATGSIAMLL